MGDFLTCCMYGAIDLQPLPPPPPFLQHLLTHHGPEARHFQQSIRSYNNALAFTSLGVKDDHSLSQSRGPPIFKIQGQSPPCHRQCSTVLTSLHIQQHPCCSKQAMPCPCWSIQSPPWSLTPQHSWSHTIHMPRSFSMHAPD
ncbi:hypothetical protein BCR39DRAFT_474343 [Naematelia encephala]|uniref:Uncharacterized protein n=1 Tax=Naematelia encephala TaxID=71784 RepID=A0A1Y2AGN2_9TREE|nr:hypothetical protein BCR39DRAFT_474343 [Naematelia encephala]